MNLLGSIHESEVWSYTEQTLCKGGAMWVSYLNSSATDSIPQYTTSLQ